MAAIHTWPLDFGDVSFVLLGFWISFASYILGAFCRWFFKALAGQHEIFG